MSDNDYDEDGNHGIEEAQKRARFDVYNHYHDVVDGSKISHFCVQHEIFCIVSAANVTSSAELYIRDTATDQLKRMPLPCSVSGLFQDIGSGQHVFVTSTAGDLFYVHVASMGKPCRIVQGGPGAPLINDVAFLDGSVAPAGTEGGGSSIKVLLALKTGQVGYVSFDGAAAAKTQQLPGVAITPQGPPLGRGAHAVTSIETICHNEGVIVLATTPVALYCYSGPDAVAATQQAPRPIASVATGTSSSSASGSSSASAAATAASAAAQHFDPAHGRPLHIVRSYADSIPTAFVWTAHTAVVHGFFDKEQRGRIVFTQRINFPFTKDIRMRSGGFGGSSAAFGAAAAAAAAGAESGMGHGDKAPLQVVTTAFHMLLRYDHRVAVLRVPPGLPWRPRLDPAAAEARRIMEKNNSNKANETFAEFDWSDRHVFDFGRKNIRILGVVRDVENRRLYAYSDQHVWNIGVTNERVDVWKLFLERATDKEENWEHRVRFYHAAAMLAPKNSREKDIIYFHLGRAAFHMTKPSRLLAAAASAQPEAVGGKGNAAASPLQQAAASGGGAVGLSWNTNSEYEDIAVRAFSSCTMFDEIVLLLRGSSSLLSRYIERRLEVLASGSGSQAGGAQQLVLLVTFALLLRLEPKIDTAILSRAVAHAQQQQQQQQPHASDKEVAAASVAAGGAANRSANIAALNKLVDDLKSRPKLVHLLADDYVYNVITRLLESLGHLDKSVDLAIATSRYRHAVSHHCQMREYQHAASVLVEHCCTKGDYVELWYDFAGQIVTRCRKEVFVGFRKIVNAKLRASEVDYRRFIPAFIAYDESQKEKPEDKEVGHRVVSLLSLVMYLAKSSGGGGYGDGIVGVNGLPRVLNDYFLSVLFIELVKTKREMAARLLLRKGKDKAADSEEDEELDMSEVIEGQIDEVLGTEHDESAIGTLPDVSLEYALRRCVELGHTELSIRLYRLLKMPEQALTASLRLENGLERAQCFLEELANNPDSNDERTMKPLWMLLTQLVLSDPTRKRDSTEDTRVVLKLIQRSQGILRLEEVIVLLQAQEALQDFRRAVCDSLNSYTEKIKALTEQMSQATKLAETLRGDLANLDHQYGYVTAAQRCCHCKTPLLKARHEPFVVFPTCRHAFHYSCGKMMFTNKDDDLVRACCHSAEIDPRSKDGIPLWQRLFEAECPHCGEWAIQRVTAPLGDDLVHL